MFRNVGKKCFKLWCVLCDVQFVQFVTLQKLHKLQGHTIHTTA
jgi:hypothetical protein